MSSIIDAVKRLERAGSENSRAIAKLHEAVFTVADLVCQQVPAGVSLPRGYVKVVRWSNTGSEDFLTLPLQSTDEYGNPENTTLYIDGIGGPLHGDSRSVIPHQTRAGSLRFSADVADGLLYEIAAWLESRSAEAERAAYSLSHDEISAWLESRSAEAERAADSRDD